MFLSLNTWPHSSLSFAALAECCDLQAEEEYLLQPEQKNATVQALRVLLSCCCGVSLFNKCLPSLLPT